MEDSAHPDADREFATALGTAPTVLAADTQPQRQGRTDAVSPEFASRLWTVPGLQNQRPVDTTMPLAQFHDADAVAKLEQRDTAWKNNLDEALKEFQKSGKVGKKRERCAEQPWPSWFR